MDIPLYEGDAVVLHWGELSWRCRVYRSTERCGTCGGPTVRIAPPWDTWQLLCCQESTLTTTVAEQQAAFDTLAPGAIGMVSALLVQVRKTRGKSGVNPTDDTLTSQGEPDDSPKACPACQTILRQGYAVLSTAWLSGKAYLCTTCKVIYAHDLQFLARIV